MKFVCITGMHRSGTSLAAAIANLLGVDLGDPQDLADPLPDNPKGFWEHTTIREINDAVLACFGGTWYEPPELPPGWELSEQLAPLRDRAKELVSRAFAGKNVAGFKDPRSSITLPFWKAVMPINEAILCVRHPGEVAQSLKLRNGIDSETAARLWLRYTSDAWLNHPASLICRYDGLLEDPAGHAEMIAGHLGLEAPSPDKMDKVTALVDPALRHHNTPAMSGGRWMRLAEAVFELTRHATAQQALAILEMFRLHSGVEQPASPARPGPVSLQTRQLMLICDWARHTPMAARAWLVLPRRWGLLDRAIRKKVRRLASRAE